MLGSKNIHTRRKTIAFQLIIADGNDHVRVLAQGEHAYTLRDPLQKVAIENFVWKDNMLYIMPFSRLTLMDEV